MQSSWRGWWSRNVFYCLTFIPWIFFFTWGKFWPIHAFNAPYFCTSPDSKTVTVLTLWNPTQLGNSSLCSFCKMSGDIYPMKSDWTQYLKKNVSHTTYKLPTGISCIDAIFPTQEATLKYIRESENQTLCFFDLELYWNTCLKLKSIENDGVCSRTGTYTNSTNYYFHSKSFPVLMPHMQRATA